MLAEKELITKVADILRKERIRNNFTLDKLAEKSDSDYSTVSLIENAKQNPRIYTVYKLLYSLDIDLVTLLDKKSGEMNSRKTAIFNKFEKLDIDTLEAISEIIDKVNLSKK